MDTNGDTTPDSFGDLNISQYFSAMDTQPPPLPKPLPKPLTNERHQRFAILILQGRYLADAYLESGFQCTRVSAYASGHRLSIKPVMRDYLQAVMVARNRQHEQQMAAIRAHLANAQKR